MLTRPDDAPPPAAGHRRVAREAVGFLLVGGGGALAFTVLSTLMADAVTMVPRWLTISVCYLMFLGPVYLLHRRFSFRSGAAHRRAAPRYVAVQLASVVVVAALSFVLIERLGLPTLPAIVAVLGLTALVNFVVLRLWAFADAV